MSKNTLTVKGLRMLHHLEICFISEFELFVYNKFMFLNTFSATRRCSAMISVYVRELTSGVFPPKRKENSDFFKQKLKNSFNKIVDLKNIPKYLYSLLYEKNCNKYYQLFFSQNNKIFMNAFQVH